ncbi:hypothetical protein DFQ13_108112 [Actinokineospora spheciospongiae]|nr:hypothetical protein DFQ13_108112 [Actinokineospora spheciospongiae]
MGGSQHPDEVWSWVGPRVVVALLVICGLVCAGFQVRVFVGCALAVIAVCWVGFCFRTSRRWRELGGHSRWYVFCERFGRPFHSA